MKTNYYYNWKTKWGVKYYLLIFSLLICATTSVYGQDKERRYADVQQVRVTAGNIENEENAINKNPREYSTLSMGLGLGNLFYARQFLDFGELIEAGTPVTIKFSVPTSVLGVADNFSFQPYTNLREAGLLNRWTADEAGDSYTGANLLTLLGGVGTHEITLTPEEDFEGVWVNLSSGLSVATSMGLYHAYIEEDIAEPYTCIEGNTPVDVLSGVGGEGLDLAGGLTFVDNPYNVIDDVDEYSTMGVVLGALNYAYHTTIFQSPSEPDQVVRIVLEQPGSLLDLSLLSAFTIQPMLGDEEVGAPIAGDSGLLTARLLSGSQKYELAFPVSGSFDRIRLELDGAVNLLENLRIYEVSRLPRVNLLDEPELTETLTSCGQVNLLPAISNYEPEYYTYRFYEQETGGTAMESATVSNTGTYYIEAEDKVTGCLSARVAVNATVNEYPEISFDGETSYQIAPGESVTFPSATGPNIQWYDDEGNEMASAPTTRTFDENGAFEYRVEATSAEGCVTTEVVTIIVSSDCPPAYPLTYNTGQEYELSELPLLGTELGIIEDPENAADGDLSTYSTLTEPVNLLGITGETSQTLDFGQALNAGEKVTVKLAKDYGLASVIGGVYVVPVDSDGNEVGPRNSADPNLAAVANGLNVFEYSFTPTDDNGVATEFSGVKVILASVLNVIQSVRVYDAYYTQPEQDFVCSGTDAFDIYSGYEAILLEADLATTLISTTNEENAIDGDLATYAELNNAVAANAYNKLMINFETPAIPGDTVDVVFGHEGSLLDANVLGALKVQRYLDGVPVEDPVTVESSLLTLRLLSGDGLAVASLPVDVPFDKVKITYGGVADALEQFNIYEVRRRAATQLPDGEGELNEVALCEGGELSLDGLPTNCDTSYLLYDAEYGGEEIPLEDIANYEGGKHTLWIQPVRNGCESMARGVLTLDITGLPDAPEVVSDHIWVGVQGTANLAVQNPDEDITYNWYDSADNLLDEGTESYEATEITSDVTLYVEAVAGEECTSTNLTEVNLEMLPTPIIDPETLTVKQGDTDTFITTNAPDGTEVLWYDEAGDQVNTDTNNPEYSIPTDLAPGDYTYTSIIRDPETGSTSEPTSVEVTVLDDLAPPTVTPPSATYIEGYTETFIASHDNPDVTFTWYDPDGNEVASTPEYTTPDDLPVGDYVYTVTASDEATDRVSDPIEVPVSVEPLLLPTVTPPSATYLEGDTETFTASHDDPDVIFTWYGPEGNEIASTSEYSTPDDLEVGEYTYTVTATDPNTNIESEPAEVDVTVIEQEDLLPPDVDPEMAVILEGETASFTASSENTEPVDYVWYNESDDEVFVGENFTTPDDLPVGEHTYEVTSRDQDNPDRESVPTSITVEVQAKMLPPEVTPSEATVIVGQTTGFKADSDNPEPVEYVWYDDSGVEVFVGENFTTPDDLPIREHTYEVTSRHPENTDNESDPVEITVVVEPLSPPEVVPSEATITEGETADFTASSENPDPVEYVWYDESGGEVFVGENFTTPDNLLVGEHTYEVTSRNPEFSDDPDYESDAVEISVTVEEAAELLPPEVEPETATIVQGEAVTYTATTDYPDGEIVWYDEDGHEIAIGEEFTAGPGLTPGNYTYDAVVRDPDTNEESEPTQVSLTVTEPTLPEDCLPAYERSYASSQTSEGTVNNGTNAVDGNLGTYSTIPIPSLYGTNAQTLQFAQAYNPSNGDELHIKVSTDVELSLLGSVTITAQAYDADNPVGEPAELSGGVLLNLLAGENELDIVVPVGSPDPSIDFDAVRLEVQGALASAGGINVHEAYVNQEAANLAECNAVEDILTGSTSGALGTLNGVENKENAVDGALETAATIRQNVGAAGYVHLTTLYSAPSVAGDSIRMVIADQDAGLLDLGVATGLKIVAYMGNTPVEEVDVEEGLVNLKLLGGGNQWQVSAEIDQPFDRISIQLGGIASALEGVNIYEIERVPGISLEGNEPGETFVEACPDGTVNLDAPEDSCTSYVWYDEAFGGEVIGDANLEFEIPEDWEAGEHTIYVQPVRYGCEEGLGRIEVTIDVQDAPATPVVESENVRVNPGDDAILEIAEPETGITYNWYDAEEEGDLVDSGSGITLTEVTEETILYVEAVSDNLGCISEARTMVTISLNEPPVANDDMVSTTLDTPVIISILDNDEEGSAPLDPVSVTIITNPVNGTALVNADGTIEYTPNNDYVGDDTIVYTVEDENGLVSNSAGVTIAVNDGPAANNDIAETERNTPVSIAVLDNDTAGTSDLNPETLSIVTEPANGTYTINSDGTIEYTPNAGYLGEDTFTYTVEDENGLVSNEATVTVSVTRYLTPPAVVPAEVTVSEGETTIYTATTEHEDVEFVWFDEEGNEILVGGDQYTTPENLQVGDYTYDVIIRDITDPGIVSEPTTVLLQVVPPSELEDCTVANAQTNGTISLCVLCDVEDPELAVDGDIDTYSRFVTPASVTGGVWQELVFPNRGQAGDTITVHVGSESSLADVNVLGGLSAESYNDNNANNDGGAIGDATIDLEVLPGDTRGEISFVAGGDFDRVRLEYRPLVGLLDSGWQIYQAEVNYQGPTLLPEDTKVCLGESVTLEATPAEGTTIRWYDAEVGGTLLSEENTYTTDPMDIVGEVTYYIAVVYNGCEDSKRIPVNVNVLDAPGAEDIAVETDSPEYCEGEEVGITATAEGITEPIFTWYFDENKENPIEDPDGLTYLIDNGELSIKELPVGTHTYYVSVKDGEDGCESIAGDLAEVTVTVNASATDTDIQTSDAVICFGETAELEAASATIDDPVFNWYDNEDLVGDPVFTGAVMEQDDLAVGSYTYYITVQNDETCENTAEEAVAATVVVEHQITADDIELPENLSQCVGSTVMLNAGTDIDVENPVFNWYFDAEGNQQITDGTEVDGVSYSVNNGEMTVDGLTGTVNYYVSLEGDNVCGSIDGDLAMVEVNMSDELEAPEVAASEIEVCMGEDTVLSVLNPQDNLTYNWYTVDAGGTSEFTGEDFELTNVTSDATYYVEAVGEGGCESETRTEVTITVNDYATADDISLEGATEICDSDDLVLEPSVDASITGSVFQWYMDADKTMPVNNGDVDGEVTYSIDANGLLSVSGLSEGSYIYYVSVEGDGVCENQAGDLAAVEVTVGAAQEAPEVTPTEQYVTVGDDAEAFEVIDLESGEAVWYSNEELTEEVERGDSYVPSTDVTGTFTYYVVVEEGPCISEVTEIVLYVTEVPTPPEECYIADDEDHGSSTLCALCSVQNPTNAIDENPDNHSRLVMSAGLVSGSVYQTLMFDHAGKAGDNVMVDLAVPGGLADISVLGGISLTLYNGDTEVDQYDLNDSLLEIRLLSGGRGEVFIPASGAYDRVEIRNTAGVATLLESVDIYGAYILQAEPELDIPDPLEICEGEEYIITAVPAEGTILNWYNSDNELLYTGTNFEVPSEMAGEFTYSIEVIDEASGCPSPERIEFDVIVDDAPRAEDIAVETDSPEYCEGEEVGITATAGGINNPIFTWYFDENKENPIEDPDGLTYIIENGELIIKELPVGTHTYYVSVKDGEEGCESIAGDLAEVSVTINPSATADDLMVSDAEICLGESIELTANSEVEGAIFRFYADAELTTELENTEVSPEADTTYYVTVSGDGVCENTPGAAATITIEVNEAGTPTTENPEQEFCDTDAATVADLDVNEAAVVWYAEAEGGEPLAMDASLEDGETYYAGFDPEEGCESTERLEVNVTINPSATTDDLMVSDAEICLGESIELTASSEVEGAIFRFYADAELTTELETTEVSPEANTTYYVTVSGDGVCENAPGAAASITIEVNEAGTPTTENPEQEFCDTDAATVADLDVNEAAVVWYAEAEGGEPLAMDTSLEDGETYYAGFDPEEGCESAERLAVSVTINPSATADDLMLSDAEICLGESIELTASSEVDNAVYRFYADAELTTELETTEVSTEEDTTYYVTVSGDGVCENAPGDAATITVEVNDSGTPTTDNQEQEFCDTDVATVADLDVDVNEVAVVWYAEAEGGEPLAMDASLEDGETYYAGFDPEEGCESAERLAVTVTINPSATADDLMVSDAEICLGESIELTASSEVEGAIFRFYADAELTTELENTEVSPEADTTYYVTVSGDGVCENAPGDAATITVEVNDSGTPTTDNQEQEFCDTDVATVADLDVNEADVVWYAEAEVGEPLAIDTELEDGASYYAGFDPEEGCESAERLAVSVTINPSATADDLMVSDAEICLGESIELTANSEVEGAEYRFYADAELTTELEATEVSPEEDTTYYVTVSGDGVCENAPGNAATLTIEVNDSGTPTTENPEQEFCDTDAATVADLDVNEADVVWYAEAEGGEPLAMDTPLEEGIYYAGFDPEEGCESAERLAVTVTINPSATADDLMVSDSEICLGESIELTASSEVDNAVYRFYADAELTTELEATEVSPEADATYYVTVSGDGVCENAPGDAATITVEVNDSGAPTTDDPVQEFCAVNKPIVADLEVNEADVVWYAEAEGGEPLPMDTPLEEGIYYAGFTSEAEYCEGSQRLSVEVNINEDSASADDIIVEDAEICIGQSYTLSASTDIANATLTFYSDAGLTSEIEDLEVMPEEETTYYVTVRGEGVCENSPGDAATITVSLRNNATPTTENSEQTFCESEALSLSNLQVNENDIVWYADAEGEEPLSEDTLLEDQVTYYAGFDPESGCESGELLAISVMLNQDDAGHIDGNSEEVCYMWEETYTTASGMEEYVWMVEGGEIVEGGGPDDDYVTVSWYEAEENYLSVSYLDENSCSGEVFATLDVELLTCSDINIGKTVDNDTPNIGEEITFTITVNNEGNYPYKDIQVSDELPAGYRYISSTATYGSYSSVSGRWSILELPGDETATLEILVEVLPEGDYRNVATLEDSTPTDPNDDNNEDVVELAPICLTVYNEFTPNGDGSNDYFRIDCIEQYPDNKLKIYNRYGDMVFETSGYENDWDGTANKGPISHDRLPVGTYFYVLELEENNTVKKGWLYLMR